MNDITVKKNVTEENVIVYTVIKQTKGHSLGVYIYLINTLICATCMISSKAAITQSFSAD